MTRSRDQLRSEFAWKVVEGVPAPKREEFQRIAVGAPAMIMSNGLMQSLAYLAARLRQEFDVQQVGLRLSGAGEHAHLGAVHPDLEVHAIVEEA